MMLVGKKSRSDVVQGPMRRCRQWWRLDCCTNTCWAENPLTVSSASVVFTFTDPTPGVSHWKASGKKNLSTFSVVKSVDNFTSLLQPYDLNKNISVD